MKYIQLTNSKELTIVDDEDYEMLINLCPSWTLCNSGVKDVPQHIHVGKDRDGVMMHRVIMGLKWGDIMIVDHIDFNTLNNQRVNLRLCTKQQNAFHSRKYSGTSSKYKGVTFDSARKLWKAKIGINGKEIYGGRFVTEKEAALKANELMLKHHKEFAVLNVIAD